MSRTVVLISAAEFAASAFVDSTCTAATSCLPETIWSSEETSGEALVEAAEVTSDLVDEMAEFVAAIVKGKQFLLSDT